MAQCKFCNKNVSWVKVRGKNIPVDAIGNLLPAKHGTSTGITETGQAMKGFIVGDACEDGYFIVNIIHKCE